MVPKGAKVHKEGSLLVVEDMGTYSARRFVEIEGKIAQIQEQQNALKAQIEGLRKSIMELQKTRLLSSDSKAGEVTGETAEGKVR